MVRRFGDLDAVTGALGTTDWVRLDKARVNDFADFTGDHQWIHTDQQRAADGPDGSTIAHGCPSWTRSH